MDLRRKIRSRSQLMIPLLLALFGLVGCVASQPDLDNLAGVIRDSITEIKTVQAHVDVITNQQTLKQELWVQHPNLLRTETEEGPGAFQGMIVVLNDKEGWFYNPSLDMAMIVDRTDYTPAIGLQQGSTLLEVMPTDVIAALATDSPRTLVGGAEIAGRQTHHIELILDEDMGIFDRGPLNLWLDKQNFYPLRVQTAGGLEIRFVDVWFDAEIDPVTFDFVPPPGATVRRIGEE